MKFPDNMTKEQALDFGIEHYKENLFLAKTEDLGEDDISEEECSLCKYGAQQKKGKDGSKCEYCPIFEHTGHRYCNNTPWMDLSHELSSGEPDKENVITLVKEELALLEEIKSKL